MTRQDYLLLGQFYFSSNGCMRVKFLERHVGDLFKALLCIRQLGLCLVNFSRELLQSRFCLFLFFLQTFVCLLDALHSPDKSKYYIRQICDILGQFPDVQISIHKKSRKHIVSFVFPPA